MFKSSYKIFNSFSEVANILSFSFVLSLKTEKKKPEKKLAAITLT